MSQPKMEKLKNNIVPVILAVMGSSVVIMLDMEFLTDQLKMGSWVAIMMLITLEGLFIYLPFSFAKSEVNWFFSILRAILYSLIFISSVTPAALQLSGPAMQLEENTVSTVREEIKDLRKQLAKETNRANQTGIQMEISILINTTLPDLAQKETKTEEKKEVKHTPLYNFIKVNYALFIVFIIQLGSGTSIHNAARSKTKDDTTTKTPWKIPFKELLTGLKKKIQWEKSPPPQEPVKQPVQSMTPSPIPTPYPSGANLSKNQPVDTSESKI